MRRERDRRTQSRRAVGPFALSEGRLSFASSAPSDGDYASIPSNAAIQQASTWAIAFKARVNRVALNAPIISQWNWTTGKSRFLINSDGAGSGISVYIGNGSNNALGSVGRTSTGVLVSGVDTEMCMVFDGTQGTDAGKLKLYSRAVGGTWALNTWNSIGSIPATCAAPNEPLTLGVMPGFGYYDGLLWDVRMYSSAVVPSGTADISLSTCNARFRFKEGAGFTSASEVGGLTATLASSYGGVHRPGWIVDGWRASVGAKKILAMGDSKTAGNPYVGAWREECVNRLAARWGKSVDMVGRNTDAAGLAAFASNAQHSAAGGATIGGLATWAVTDVPLYAPDLIVLEGGTNDIVTLGLTASQTRDEMGLLIDACLAGSATAKVVVLTDFIISNAFTATQATYNALLPALVAGKGARVSLVDTFAVTRIDMLNDSLHPNENAYRRIAEVIADAIGPTL